MDEAQYAEHLLYEHQTAMEDDMSKKSIATLNEPRVQEGKECSRLRGRIFRLEETLKKIIPLQGDYNEWGKKELADIINSYADRASEVIKEIQE